MTPARIRSKLTLALASGIVLAGGCNEAPPVPSNGSLGAPSGTSSPTQGVDDAGMASFAPFVDAGPPGPPGRLPAPRPIFGSTVTATGRPPPPISGGTLLVTHDGNTTVAADPDRDAVYIIDVGAKAVTFTVALQSGDEPGRIAEDGAGRVHVALRGGGALVTIDPKVGTILARRTVCPAPRGVAWDTATDWVWVACATGELVAFPSAGGAATHSFVVERDLRDVIIQNGAMAVTKFRSAELLRIASDGTVTRRDALAPTVTMTNGSPPPTPPSLRVPHVAWRAIAGPSGSIVAVHQEESQSPISTKEPNAYGASGPIVDCALSMVASDGTVSTRSLSGPAILPVDLAVTPSGADVEIVSAGAAFSAIDKLKAGSLGTVAPTSAGGPLFPSLPSDTQPIAVAFDAAGDLLVQSREPATLLVASAAGSAPTSIVLSAISRNDTGHAIFHAQAGGLIACASCHPEGGDDGHVWLLDGAPRRTPSLRGTIAGTAPYHWPGDETDLTALANDVYSGRMSGAMLDAPQMSALNGWVESIPAPPSPSWVDRAAAQRGRSLFEGVAGCATCHSGAKFTNNMTVDVGTGGGMILTSGGGGALRLSTDSTTFQVPPLVGVGWRTPILHDGCAATITDRFGRCSTASHGTIAKLSASNVTDLTAYLESL